MSAGQSPTLFRRQLGRFLREHRQGVGMTIAEAARAVQLSEAALQRLETGRQPQKIRRQDIRALCELYGVGADEIEKAITLADKAADNPEIAALGGNFSNAFNMYVGMEASARNLLSYNEQIPGLLQTADYARALFSLLPENVRSDDIEHRVDVRLKRQKIVTRKTNPLRLEVLLHESALHRMVGGPEVMAAQLRELAEIGKLPNVTLRVHPYDAGCTWGILHGQYVILDFGTDSKGRLIEPPVVYLDGGMSADLYLENPADVQRYHELSNVIRGTALDEARTRDLLRRVAKEFASDR